MSQALNSLVTPLLLTVLPAIETKVPKVNPETGKTRFENGRPLSPVEGPVVQDFFSSNPAILMRAMNLTGAAPGESEAARELREEKEALQAEIKRIESAEGEVSIPRSIFKMNARLAEIKKAQEAFSNEKYERQVFEFLKSLLMQYSNAERLHGLPVGGLMTYAEAHLEDLAPSDQAGVKAYFERQKAEKSAPVENGLPEDLA